ncbi:hypothetical protein AB8O38_12030 [Saccharomonospora xinjiangensis]|uniref:hypothetical protein n=1 Tax=Saccharomonospora xinjiangensis TaxID=75294 RepID=UPI003510BA8D
MRAKLSSEVTLASEVLVWTWRFYVRHIGVIVGLSLLPGIQRLVVVTWQEEIPSGVSVASEVAVGAVRLVLLVLIVRWAFDGVETSWAQAGSFLRKHPMSLLFHLGLLGAGFAVFDLLTEKLVGAAVPEPARDGYLGVLLLVKNPTVVALASVWLVGVVMQALSGGSAPQARRSGRGIAVR